MDYRLYHWLNELSASHPWLGHAAATLEAWSIPVFAAATLSLWVFARPGGDRKWKLACASALASAAAGLLVNQAIGHAWSRARPFAAHPDATVYGPHSTDPSFPSDHASAAVAIAVAVLLFDRVVGGILLAAAASIALGRVVAGVHYPADVVAGALVGTVVALLVARGGRPIVERFVRVVERATDPLLSSLRRAIPALRRPAAD